MAQSGLEYLITYYSEINLPESGPRELEAAYSYAIAQEGDRVFKVNIKFFLTDIYTSRKDLLIQSESWFKVMSKPDINQLFEAIKHSTFALASHQGIQGEPNIKDLLATIRPPQLDFFVDDLTELLRDFDWE